MSVINVQGLMMVYKAPVRKEGLRAAFTSLFKRTYREIRAVQGVSFEVTAGEVVGFIGPNGAGKTTTLKTLSGILHPTGGEVSVLGYTPWHRAPAFLRNLALIRGSQPIGGPVELTVLDSLRYQQLVYEVPAASFKQNLAELVAMLDLEPLLTRQIRALSLGERMRCGLALALIYRPRILFLDEPTLGLDVTAVGMMRRFLSTYSRQTGATILLTSHYMADVEALCGRILLIDKSQLKYDGNLGGSVVLLGTFQIIGGIFQTFITPNLNWFASKVKDGTLDSILTQPISSLYMVSLGKCAPLALTQVATGLLVVFLGLRELATLPTLWGLLGWLMLAATGVIVAWATRALQ